MGEYKDTNDYKLVHSMSGKRYHLVPSYTVWHGHWLTVRRRRKGGETGKEGGGSMYRIHYLELHGSGTAAGFDYLAPPLNIFFIKLVFLPSPPPLGSTPISDWSKYPGFSAENGRASFWGVSGSDLSFCTGTVSTYTNASSPLLPLAGRPLRPSSAL